MKAYLTRRYMFSASHRLHSDAMSDAENAATYGKCNNPFGHGHNYTLEVTVSGPVDAATGMVCNLTDLDDFVNVEILERFDHQNLNTLGEFATAVPTTENLCTEIYKLLRDPLERAGGPGRFLARVRLEETSLNSFEYVAERTVSS